MFNAYIITTINTFGTDKVKSLTSRCVESCKKNNITPILFDAITPYSLEEHYPGWPVREDYRERLLNNYRRKAGKEPTPEFYQIYPSGYGNILAHFAWIIADCIRKRTSSMESCCRKAFQRNSGQLQERNL